MLSETKFIVLDGIDGCGKTTQLDLLKKYFEDESKISNVVTLSFPNYNSLSGKLIKDYLNQGFEDKNSTSSVYGPTLLYSIDRYLYFQNLDNNIFEERHDDTIILSGRYTTSNIIHQMSKLPLYMWDKYIKFITDLEYNKLNLPKPTMVILLNMPVELSQKLLDERYAQMGGQKDIHERDIEYLQKCHKASLYAAKRLGWKIVNCFDESYSIKTQEDIHNEIIHLIKNKYIIQ